MKLPELEVGDIIFYGKFKNRKAVIEGFGSDKNQHPVVKTDKGEFPVFKIRLQKLMASLKIGTTALMAQDQYTLFKNKNEAEKAAKKLQKEDPEWTYKVVQDKNPAGKGLSYIEIYDEDGHLTGKV